MSKSPAKERSSMSVRNVPRSLGDNVCSVASNVRKAPNNHTYYYYHYIIIILIIILIIIIIIIIIITIIITIIIIIAIVDFIIIITIIITIMIIKISMLQSSTIKHEAHTKNIFDEVISFRPSVRHLIKLRHLFH